MNLFSHLECPACKRTYNHTKLQTYCLHDNQPLLARYNLHLGVQKSKLSGRPYDMWRYREVLPVNRSEYQTSLGEGFTPILTMQTLAKNWDQNSLLLKDEALNPTGSFKARGLSMAISKARELNVKKVSIPTAGNAGSALSAYAARGGLESRVYMPNRTPEVFQLDNEIMGVTVHKVQGTISDAAKKMHLEMDENWFDMSTLKEPYRLEGKKTMGYEIAEQLNWNLPDVIIYPTGGGTGLIGIYKAFEEMLEMGWIKEIPTRMIAVQVDGCAPIVHAYVTGVAYAPKIKSPAPTIANGLRVPHAFGDRLILETIKKSRGCAIAVTDNDMMQAIREVAQNEGIFLCPEGAATYAAYKELLLEGLIDPSDEVLLLNTGSAYKYIENLLSYDRKSRASLVSSFG